MVRKVRKSIYLDSETMSLLEYLAWISDTKKTTLLRKIVQTIGTFGFSFKKPCQINFRDEGNKLIIEFCGFSRIHSGTEDVSQNESKEVTETIIKIKGKLGEENV